jgi:hypothetical protein
VPGVARNIAEQAVHLLRDAAQRSIDVGAFNQAARHATRALDLGTDDDVLPRRDCCCCGRRHWSSAGCSIAGFADAGDVLDAAVAAGDRRHEAVARRLLGILHQRDGDLPAARLELGASVDIFRELNDDVELAVSLRERGLAEVFGGSLHDAEWLLGEAEALSERLGDRRGRAWVRQHQAWVAFLSGDTDLAERRLLTAAQEFDLLGDGSDGLGVRDCSPTCASTKGGSTRPRRWRSRCERESAALGDPLGTGDDGFARRVDPLWTTRFVEAEELSRKALAASASSATGSARCRPWRPRLRALVALGRAHEAERGIEESVGDRATRSATCRSRRWRLPVLPCTSASVSARCHWPSIAVERSRRWAPTVRSRGSRSRWPCCQVGRADEALAQLDAVVAPRRICGAVERSPPR